MDLLIENLAKSEVAFLHAKKIQFYCCCEEIEIRPLIEYFSRRPAQLKRLYFTYCEKTVAKLDPETLYKIAPNLKYFYVTDSSAYAAGPPAHLLKDSYLSKIRRSLKNLCIDRTGEISSKGFRLIFDEWLKKRDKKISICSRDFLEKTELRRELREYMSLFETETLRLDEIERETFVMVGMTHIRKKKNKKIISDNYIRFLSVFSY